MIAKAAAEADARLSAAERRRLSLRVAFADDLGARRRIDRRRRLVVRPPARPEPVPGAARGPPGPAARRRIVRLDQLARGLIGGWLPDDDFDDALIDVGEEARDWGDGSATTCATSARPIAQMRRAGYADVTARAARASSTAFDVDGAVGFLTEFDEDDLVTSLGDRRPAFEAALRRRLARRPAGALALAQPHGDGARRATLSAAPSSGARASALGRALALGVATLGLAGRGLALGALGTFLALGRPPARARPRRAVPGPWRRSPRDRSGA